MSKNAKSRKNADVYAKSDGVNIKKCQKEVIKITENNCWKS